MNDTHTVVQFWDTSDSGLIPDHNLINNLLVNVAQEANTIKKTSNGACVPEMIEIHTRK